MTINSLLSKIVFVFLFVFVAHTSGDAQYFSNYNPNEEVFTYEVKLIDEFIERFNDEPTSYLRKVYAKEKKQYNISRGKLLVSLFNLDNSVFTDKDTSLKGFFREVLDPVKPVYISFTDSDWYAEAETVFLLDGKLVELPLIFHTKSKGKEWTKWMIAGVGNTTANHDPMPSISLDDIKNSKAPKFIPTSAYSTNFVELHHIFSGNMEPEYYFEPALLHTATGSQFVQQIKSGKLKFQYVKKQTFHFYQINDWVLTVEQFNRKTLNSGWLISSAMRTSASEKEESRKKLLHR